MELTSSNSTSVFDSLRQRMKMPPIETFIVSREDPNQWSRQMVQALRTHWPEYLMEATELGLFMIAACSFTVLLYHPAEGAQPGCQSEALEADIRKFPNRSADYLAVVHSLWTVSSTAGR